MRIVFMGTPEFAVTTLKHLVENNYNVVGVITAPDRPAGRGRQLKQSAVKQYALANDLEVLQPTNLKNEAFIADLQKWDADIQIVVAFRMLPKIVWAMPTYGTFNLHASLLPQYRGAAPINWAIINGETQTGNTTFFIDDKIDTGNIILQETLDIGANESAGSLHDRLMFSGAQLVAKTIDLIKAGNVETIEQPDFEPKTAYKLNKDNTKIDWTISAEKIHNLIRGLSPYPSSWCFLTNKGKRANVKILEANLLQGKTNIPLGFIRIEDKFLKVGATNGTILIKKMQLPNKKAMLVSDLLNGYDFEVGAFFD